MDDFFCETPEHFLLGLVRVTVLDRATGAAVPGAVVTVADCRDKAVRGG